jgi:hypothetical protein
LDDFVVSFAFFLSNRIVTLRLVLEGHKTVTVLEKFNEKKWQNHRKIPAKFQRLEYSVLL